MQFWMWKSAYVGVYQLLRGSILSTAVVVLIPPWFSLLELAAFPTPQTDKQTENLVKEVLTLQQEIR